METKQPRGGKRPGAGRPKAEYTTTTVSFRVRTEWAADIKKAVKEMINTIKCINQ